jgi:hypothetical protein
MQNGAAEGMHMPWRLMGGLMDVARSRSRKYVDGDIELPELFQIQG